MAQEHKLVDGLIRSFEEQEDCDVKFSIDGRMIATHKVVLRVGCQTLYDLSSNWTYDKEPISIDDIDYDSFKELLRFMYGDVPISDNNVFPLLSGAMQFKMKDLEKLCAGHLRLTVDNVCTFMEEAINFNCVAIQENCRDLFSDHCSYIITTPSFMGISQPALSSFLDVNESNTAEFDLFLGIKQWMKQKCEEEKVTVNGENMRRIIGDALYKIRFPTVTSQQFANSVSTIDGLLSDREMIQVFKKISVFDNDDIECPFSSKLRCKISEFSGAISDMLELCDAPIIYDYILEKRCNLNTVFRNWKDSVDGGKLDITTVSIVLQCCADLANTINQTSCATPTNQDIREELFNDFTKWEEIAETKNATDTMTKFMDMRKNLNKLCRWSL